MTREEFIKFVEATWADKKELSKDDIYMIGVAHRELPKEEKSWQLVADLVGWNGSSESLRKYVSGRMKREGLTIMQEEKTTQELEVEQPVEKDEFETKMQKLLKQQQKMRDWSSLYRRYLREDSRIDSLKEFIKDAVTELHNLPIVPISKSVNENKKTEAVLMLSDLHIGTIIDNFANKFDDLVAINRVNKLVKDTIRYCEQFNVVRLNIVNLGDLIAGIIHTTIRLDQQFDVITQVMKAGEIVANALNQLQAAAPEVIYRSVTDNHARVIANKNDAIEKENFSRLIDWFLQERLKDTDIKFAFDNLDESLGKFDLLNGQKVMFSHGHLDTKNCVFQNYVGATKEFIDYILLGHFHNFEIKSFQQCRVFINGSIVGTDGYATSRRLFGKPSQTLLIFDDITTKNPNIIPIDIALD